MGVSTSLCRPLQSENKLRSYSRSPEKHGASYVARNPFQGLWPLVTSSRRLIPTLRPCLDDPGTACWHCAYSGRYIPAERRADPLDELIPVGGDSEKIWRFDTLWEAENFVLNKTKGGELLVRVSCETGDTRTAKIESFFSGLFSCGAPINSNCLNYDI